MVDIYVWYNQVQRTCPATVHVFMCMHNRNIKVILIIKLLCCDNRLAMGLPSAKYFKHNLILINLASSDKITLSANLHMLHMLHMHCSYIYIFKITRVLKINNHYVNLTPK